MTAAQTGLVHSSELAAFEAALDAAYGALAAS